MFSRFELDEGVRSHDRQDYASTDGERRVMPTPRPCRILPSDALDFDQRRHIASLIRSQIGRRKRPCQPEISARSFGELATKEVDAAIVR